MKKFIALCAVSSMALSSSIYGSDLSNTEAPATTEETPVTPEENPGTPVSAGSNTAEKEARKKMWISVAIATVAVAIAVTALVLVAGHHGKKASK
jgi:hypothetical protein